MGQRGPGGLSTTAVLITIALVLASVMTGCINVILELANVVLER